MYEYFEILLHIAKKAGLYSDLKSSTSELGNELRISQQSISRILREMETIGLIKRNVTPEGIKIGIIDKGREFLKKNYGDLTNIFSGKKELFGKVVSGIGEGGYYMSLSNYQKQFIEKIGFKPFKGTLNLNVNTNEAKEFLINLKEILINGFKTNERTFGALKCYKIKINGINAAIIKPERGRYGDNIIEIISSFYLRKKLSLKDNDKVKLTI